MGGVQRGEEDGEGVFVEGVAVDLREVAAVGAARVEEEHHHVAMAVQHAVHVLRGQDDLPGRGGEDVPTAWARWARRRGTR